MEQLSLASPEAQVKDHRTLREDTSIRPDLEAEVSLTLAATGSPLEDPSLSGIQGQFASFATSVCLSFLLCTVEGTHRCLDTDITKPRQRTFGDLLLCLNILHMTLTSSPGLQTQPCTKSLRTLVTRNMGYHSQLCRRSRWL